MKKKFRVKSEKDFQNVINNGHKVVSKSFIVYYLNTDVGYNRVGISVGKKILKRAVDRNYQKRVIREIVKNIYSKLIGSNDIIIILKKNGIDFSYDCKQKILFNMFFEENLIMEEFNVNY